MDTTLTSNLQDDSGSSTCTVGAQSLLTTTSSTLAPKTPDTTAVSAENTPKTVPKGPAHPVPPFTQETQDLLNSSQTATTQSSSTIDWNLPGTYHNAKYETLQVQSDISAFIKNEVDVTRITTVESHKLLWLAGRPMNARALHRQIMMGRQIMATEQVDMHLVWYESIIYIKPLPAWILSTDFWKAYLCGDDSNTRSLHASALGLLISYTWLICHLSDFHLAKDLHLIPEHITFEGWSAFVSAFLKDLDEKLPISSRYRYGELRLARLNAIYRYSPQLRFANSVRGYFYLHHTYSSFFARRFSWVTIRLFAYMAIVLTALQVGLGTDGLKEDKLFNQLSYWFTLVSIFLPLGLVGLVVALFIFYFLDNLVVALCFNRKKKKEWRKGKTNQRV